MHTIEEEKEEANSVFTSDENSLKRSTKVIPIMNFKSKTPEIEEPDSDEESDEGPIDPEEEKINCLI